MADWTSNAHKVFVTAERGVVALEMVSDASPVRRSRLELSPLEARSLANWLNEQAKEASIHALVVENMAKVNTARDDRSQP